jgi:pyruvate/2-oxoglutarate dehydrogenase complex dihydrolipoamide acyltransferase (E2) component
VAKKTAKVLKGLKKDVAKLQELRDLLEERLAGRDADPVEQGDNPRDDKGPEVTEAAQRRAEELGVDLADVKGTGSGGRVLLKDVEAAANEYR